MKTSVCYFMIGLMLILSHCQSKPDTMNKSKIDVQGHRGTRGLMPENTTPAFIKAVELGVTTLELDLAVTKDKELLVSHEPYMGAHITRDSSGQDILASEELQHNIYMMAYEQIKTYDVGSKINERFPLQKKFKIHKPLLKEVVTEINKYLASKQLPAVYYNIEIKSRPEGDGMFHPLPDEHSQLVYDFISTEMDTSKLNIQSFDFRILQYYNKNYPEIKLAALVENERSIEENLSDLGFMPEIYSCYFKLLDAEKVQWLQNKGIKVIPWTVNETQDIKKVLDWGVDGIISDYPNRVLELISS